MRNNLSKSPLHCLAASNTETARSAVQHLLETRQHRVDERNEEGTTPLHVAAAADNLAMSQLLLCYGADPLLEDEEGRTPVDVSIGKTRSFFRRSINSKKGPSKRIRNTLARAFRFLFSCSSRNEKEQSREFEPFTSWSLLAKGSLSDDTLSRHLKVTPSAYCVSGDTATSVKETDISGRFSPVRYPRLSPARNHESKRRQSLQNGRYRSDSVYSTSNSAETSSFMTARDTSICSDRSPQLRKLGRSSCKNGSCLNTPSPKNAIRCKLPFPNETEKLPVLSAQITDDSDAISEEEEGIPSNVMAMVSHMENRQIKQELAARGVIIGPLTPSTRGAYEKKLARMIAQLPSPKANQLKYSAGLERVLAGFDCTAEGRKLDEMVISDFFVVDSEQCREGKRSTSFCYILIDPSLIDLPSTCNFKTFVNAIFYVGKGKRSRPFEHLTDAVRYKNPKTPPKTPNQESTKLRRINEIWASGFGVVSLHIFQNTIPIEALTREAAMIDAVGLNHLTNVKRGDYYGICKDWSLRQKTTYGAYLLMRALNVFHVEGCRQLFEHDVTDA